jgi:hypothetical protein
MALSQASEWTVAGNDDNPHPPAWMLLCDARAWVEALCKNRSVAERILLDHLDGVNRQLSPPIRWEWRKIHLPLGRSGVAMHLVFFHPGPDARLDIDWDASGAVYFGPIPILSIAPDDPNDRWPTFPKGIPPGRVDAYLIRVHRGDVLAVLRSRGLLPPVSGVLAATEGGVTARVTATSAPAASATVTPQQTPTQELPEPSSSPSSRPSLPPGERPFTITDRPPSRPAAALEDLRKAYPQGDLSNRKYAAQLYPLLVAKSGNAWSLATLARRLSDKKQDPLGPNWESPTRIKP